MNNTSTGMQLDEIQGPHNPQTSSQTQPKLDVQSLNQDAAGDVNDGTNTDLPPHSSSISNKRDAAQPPQEEHDDPPANIDSTVLAQALARPHDGFPMAQVTSAELQERNTPQCQNIWRNLAGWKTLIYAAYCKINIDPNVMQAPIQTKLSALLSRPVSTRLAAPSDRFQGGKAEHDFLVHQGCFAFPDITFFCYGYGAPPPPYAITLRHLPLGFTADGVRDLLRPHYLKEGSRNFYAWLATHKDNIPAENATDEATITAFIANSLMVEKHEITIDNKLEVVYKIFLHPPSVIAHTPWLNHLRTFGYETEYGRHTVFKDVLCILCKARDHKVVDCPFRRLPGFPTTHPNAPDNVDIDGPNDNGPRHHGGNTRGRGGFFGVRRGRGSARAYDMPY
ncbi:hypothetical protein M422DRAFT_31309 [Sphaerobolus stellatus SS14]|uniref:Uncharacterized protein n=1 Tax=Sphaerobolus stellatus (strain SS14) TaxID=990650 RepID=A0A0C9VVL0_SPHS4|nr:hypothetical protein M422DRAFT_31309 [Sphaerobolus stellatus SS14]